MIGLLNQAFSGEPTRPLLAVFEARPMMIGLSGEVRVITRMKSFSSVRGFRVTMAEEARQCCFDETMGKNEVGNIWVYSLLIEGEGTCLSVDSPCCLMALNVGNQWWRVV